MRAQIGQISLHSVCVALLRPICNSQPISGQKNRRKTCNGTPYLMDELLSPFGGYSLKFPETSFYVNQGAYLRARTKLAQLPTRCPRDSASLHIVTSPPAQRVPLSTGEGEPD
jgi:hypothetical protein